MSFLSIFPRDYKFTPDAPIRLRVVRDDGVEVSPDIKFNKITLSGNVKIFRNQSGEQDSFSITVLLNSEDSVSGVTPGTGGAVFGSMNLIELLDDCIRGAVPFMISTEAIGIDHNELWLVTEQKKRVQTHDRTSHRDLDYEVLNGVFVEWDLTFTKYKEVNLGTFRATSVGVTEALKAYEKKKNSTKKATSKTQQKTTVKDKLYKCNYKVLVYSKKKKVVECVKVLQERLWLAGKLTGNKKSDVCDGWFGDSTKNAVAKWQKAWGTKYGLRVDGYVDKATWLALCGRGKVPTVTTTVTNGSKFTNAKQGTVKQTVDLVGGVGSSTPTTLTVSVKSTTVKKSTAQKIVNVTTKQTSKLTTPTTKKTTTTTFKKNSKVTKMAGTAKKVVSKSAQKKTTKNKKK